MLAADASAEEGTAAAKGLAALRGFLKEVRVTSPPTSSTAPAPAPVIASRVHTSAPHLAPPLHTHPTNLPAPRARAIGGCTACAPPQHRLCTAPAPPLRKRACLLPPPPPRCPATRRPRARHRQPTSRLGGSVSGAGSRRAARPRRCVPSTRRYARTRATRASCVWCCRRCRRRAAARARPPRMSSCCTRSPPAYRPRCSPHPTARPLSPPTSEADL